MTVIDAHVHVFAKASSAFPREVTNSMPGDAEAPVELLLEDMAASGVDRAVLVQIGGQEYEQHAYLQHCLQTYPDRFRGIGLVPDTEHPEDHMDRLSGDGSLIGFRLFHIGGPPELPTNVDIRTFDTYPIWQHAAERDYVLWLYPKAADAPQVPYLMEAFPELRVVFNHMMFCPDPALFKRDASGRPRIDSPIPPATGAVTLDLSRFANVCVKLSGQYAFSREAYPYRDLAEWHRTLVSTFGADRCMWATDFPFIRENPGYARQAGIVEELLPDLGDEERDSVMGGSAARMLWREGQAFVR